MFEKSDWIWPNSENLPDEYAEFKININIQEGKKYIFNIAADTNYSVDINGTTTFFGQFCDYPFYKVYDSIDITDMLKTGDNEIKIYAFYMGGDFATYYYKGASAGIIYEIVADGEIISVSCSDTLSRLSPHYESHNQTILTVWKGFTFTYNSIGADIPWGESHIKTDIGRNFHKRPNKMLVLRAPVSTEIVRFGSFVYGEGELLGQRMQNARLYEANFKNGVLSSDNKGIFIISQLEKGDCGFVHFDIELPEDCEVHIGYGEHLTDGICRTSPIPSHNHTAVYKAHKGRNVFTERFMRFGCRYVQLFIQSNSAVINYVGLRTVDYPIVFKPFSSGNKRRDRIYEVAANTLRCCMHEHYEDGPMREGALYAHDSRNQMQFTYYGTENPEFARASLTLMNKGTNPRTRLLSLTFPSYTGTCIPSYTPSFVLAVDEYIRHTGDTSLGKETYETLKALNKRFESKSDERGIISNFNDEERGEGVSYWDFFDWTETMKGSAGVFDYECPLNAWYSLMLGSMASICRYIGLNDEADIYLKRKAKLDKAIAQVFFDADAGVFKTYENRRQGTYSVYNQSLCVLCSAADYVPKSEIIKVLETNGEDFTYPIDRDTLASCGFRYDALMSIDLQKYKDLILDDIDRVYGAMLDKGATTFWETEKGESDFKGGGSLCHAWSAAPLKYYRMLILGENR